MPSAATWNYIRKLGVCCVGAVVGMATVYKIYDPLEEMKMEIEDGKIVILREYAPRYEELSKQVEEELKKIKERERINERLAVNG
ncbi:unnamed protein product [Meloidogyne enterolobii]|uniref:Uncharacterized protein n=2 Tax=Meloidogyne enterolobii TaxID=390850 RepID=A0A6V7X872_MELEN|nr:unnamed protein product [Meloidogyne enterolobii]